MLIWIEIAQWHGTPSSWWRMWFPNIAGSRWRRWFADGNIKEQSISWFTFQLWNQNKQGTPPSMGVKMGKHIHKWMHTWGIVATGHVSCHRIKWEASQGANTFNKVLTHIASPELHVHGWSVKENANLKNMLQSMFQWLTKVIPIPRYSETPNMRPQFVDRPGLGLGVLNMNRAEVWRIRKFGINCSRFANVFVHNCHEPLRLRCCMFLGTTLSALWIMALYCATFTWNKDPKSTSP